MRNNNNNKRFQALIQLPNNHLPQISIDRSLTAVVATTPLHLTSLHLTLLHFTLLHIEFQFQFWLFFSQLFFTCDVHLKDRDAVCAGCTCSKLCFKRLLLFSLLLLLLFRVFCFYGSDCLAFHFHVAQLPPVCSCTRRSRSVCGAPCTCEGCYSYLDLLLTHSGLHMLITLLKIEIIKWKFILYLLNLWRIINRFYSGMTWFIP